MKNTYPPPSQFFLFSVLKIRPSKTTHTAIDTARTYIAISASFSACRYLGLLLHTLKDITKQLLNIIQAKQITFCPRCNAEFSIPLIRCPKCKGKTKTEEEEIFEEENKNGTS